MAAATPRSGRTDPAGSVDSADRFSAIGEQASSTVRDAADILEQELSAGLEETRRLQQRFTERGRLEAGDLDDVTARVRSNAHALIDTAGARFKDLAADDVQDVVARFTKDAHVVFDALMDVVGASPVVVNRVMERVDAMTGPTAPGKTEPPPSEPTRRARPARKSAGRTEPEPTAQSPTKSTGRAATKSAGRSATKSTGRAATRRPRER